MKNKLMIVEDDEGVLEMLEAVFEKQYEVYTAENGIIAYDLFFQVRPDIIVTDVVMPGLDGPTWVSQALKTRPNVQVVFVSGYAEGALGETSPSIVNSAFLQKPFSLSQLTQTVHERLT